MNALSLIEERVDLYCKQLRTRVFVPATVNWRAKR